MEKTISLAPMVDRTDNNYRNFVRILSENTTLYTEMITDKAIINAKDRVLSFSKGQNKIVLQIATNNVLEAIEAVKIADLYNYDEINLNLGCPSDRISDNKMGAYLMSELDLVKEIVKNIKKVTDKPITVKQRIGIDGSGILENDAKYEGIDYLSKFIQTLNEAGVNKFIIHARIAILKGLNPKENRSIPPLDYDMVYKIKKMFPHFNIEINGGIKTIEEIKNHLKNVDDVMIGRKIYDDPMFLLDIEEHIFNNKKNMTRKDILLKVIEQIKDFNEKEIHMYIMHTMGLFKGTKYSKKWKQICSNTKTNIIDIQDFIKELE